MTGMDSLTEGLTTAYTDSRLRDRRFEAAASMAAVAADIWAGAGSTAAALADTWVVSAVAVADKQKQQHRYSAAVFRILP
jgi:hypothetical protein